MATELTFEWQHGQGIDATNRKDYKCLPIRIGDLGDIINHMVMQGGGSFFNAADAGAEGAEFGVHLLVAAVKVVDAVDLGVAGGGEAGDDEGG